MRNSLDTYSSRLSARARAALAVVLGAFALLLPMLTFAHEVYVLNPATIAHDIATASPNPLLAFFDNKYQFFLWGFICFVGFSTVFFMSIFHTFEEKAAGLFSRLKKYAAPLARITLGLCLIASAYNGALFGPELPFSLFGAGTAAIITAALYLSGILLTLGLYTRLAALPVLGVFCLAIVEQGSYMFTYANYFGEILFALIVGGGMYSLKREAGIPPALRDFAHSAEKYAWPILRISFGISVAYAALYAKFLHSNLALDTISQYNLTQYFHFDPLFTVLGAFIIESLIGVFYILGIEIRWNAIFFLFWLFLSLWYFGEAVWPHLVLLGLNVAFLLHGYDRYSLEGRFFKKGRLEPVL